jgi:hypothetical protein
VYQVELVLVEPGILGIINNEFEVGRNADVVSYRRNGSSQSITHSVGCPGLRSIPVTWHSGCWSATGIVSKYILVGWQQKRTHVNCPDARARANIQCISWLLYGREVQLAVEGQA